jgi:acyl carrier protein
VIKYLKNLFSKKETQFANQKKSDQEFFIENIKEMDLSINEKIEELTRRKFCLSNDEVLDSSSLTIDFGCDYIDLYELIFEIEHIFDIKVQDGGFQLNVGEIKEYVRKKIENPNYIVSDENSHFDLWPQSLEQILNEEHLSAR